MNPFAYTRAADVAAAVERGSTGAEYLAGGTDMLQLLQEDVRAPAELVDINALPIAGITAGPQDLRIGALTRLSDVVRDVGIARHFPVVRQALAETASPQVRNMATVGGNLLQRTRCLYFRDVAMPCNKRRPGSGCPAQAGRNELNAILGGSRTCIAVHPSDLAVALLAIDAELAIAGATGERRMPVADLHCLPGDTPHIETTLAPGDLIVAVHLPMVMADRASAYVKVRHRASFEWAAASCAVTIQLEDGVARDVRVVAGGIATRPWRLRQVEAQIFGRRLDRTVILAAAHKAADGASTCGDNAYKVPLLERTVARALMMARGGP